MLLFFIAILSILMLLCETAALNYKHKIFLMSALIFSIKRYLYLHLKWGGGGIWTLAYNLVDHLMSS